MSPIATPFPSPLRRPLSLRRGLPLLALALGLAWLPAVTRAQAAPEAAPATPAAESDVQGRRNQKIEHITVEDSGARVDEMRYGGVTQSINVQPKNAMPGYEVQPTDERRARQGDSAGGARVWNVLKF